MAILESPNLSEIVPDILIHKEGTRLKVELPGIGMATLGQDLLDPSAIEIKTVSVREDERGKGYGSRLMSAAIELARQQPGYKKISTEAHNERVVKSFCSHFNEEDLEFRDMYGGRGPNNDPIYVKAEDVSLHGAINFLQQMRQITNLDEPNGSEELSEQVRISAPIHSVPKPVASFVTPQ